MHYLRLTIQRNRRRIQLEQLLLLLLRIALPVLLFFFLARPVFNPTGLEQWLGTGGRSSQVVLIDDSMSMGYSAGEAPAFQRALQSAAGLLASVRPQDHCTVVTTSAPRAPVIHDVEGSRRDEISAAVAAVPLTATHAAWPAVLEGVDQVLQSCTYPTRQLTIVTDLRKSGWDAGIQAISRRWSEQGVRVRIVDVGSDEVANVALQGLVAADRTILAGAPSAWEAVIKNDSPRTSHEQQGDSARRRQADRSGAARDRAAPDRARAALGPVPGLRAARAVAQAAGRRAAGGQRGGSPSRSRTRS